MLLSIIYFILILGIVVFIHELGHFIFAKRAGVYVYEFSIGMGPRLLKFNRKKKVKDKDGKVTYVDDETDYCLRLFPIGGFVQMAGEEVEADENIPAEKRLQSKKWHQRLLVMIAGVMNNFILAFIVLLIIGWTNTVSLNSVYVDESVVKDLPTDAKIIKVNGKKVSSYDLLSLELIVQGDKKFPITIKDKDGEVRDVTINPIVVGKDNMVLGLDYGFSVATKVIDDKIEVIVLDSENDELKENMIISEVDGEKVDSYLEYLELIRDKKEFTITVDGDKKVQIETKEVKNEDLNGYSHGFSIKGKEQKGFVAGLKYACGKFSSTVKQMFWTVWYLITGKISLSMLSGPIGIYTIVDEAAKVGLSSILSLIALLNINVAFINILPLPAFDGGHALFLIIEKIKGSPVNPKVENTIHNIFFILLMILMIYVTFNDILRLF